MNDDVKQPWLSHEQKNFITGLVFSVGGMFAGYVFGQCFISEYILLPIGFAGWVVLTSIFVSTGLFGGFYLSKLMWCTCGI
jgi:hypothetical protein